MKKKLKTGAKLYHYKDDLKVLGAHDKISGDVSRIRGDVSGITGDVSGITGDLDDCEITEEDREKGINIKDLVGEE